MRNIYGAVIIRSKLDLFDLAKELSGSVFGGAIFGGYDEWIRDEVPSVYLRFLGMLFVLMEGDQPEYELSIAGRRFSDLEDPGEVDISDLMKLAIEHAGIECEIASLLDPGGSP